MLYDLTLVAEQPRGMHLHLPEPSSLRAAMVEARKEYLFLQETKTVCFKTFILNSFCTQLGFKWSSFDVTDKFEILKNIADQVFGFCMCGRDECIDSADHSSDLRDSCFCRACRDWDAEYTAWAQEYREEAACGCNDY